MPACYRFGRKVAMLLSFFTVGLVGTTTAFVPNFALYAPLRFLLGVGGMGIFMVCFLLGEPKHRIANKYVVNVFML